MRAARPVSGAMMLRPGIRMNETFKRTTLICELAATRKSSGRNGHRRNGQNIFYVEKYPNEPAFDAHKVDGYSCCLLLLLFVFNLFSFVVENQLSVTVQQEVRTKISEKAFIYRS